jgi:group I intron endonuclease
MSNSGIYRIVNTSNGKFYIGSTVDFEKRKKEHFRQLKNNAHHSKIFQNAYNKENKKDCFIFEIILICCENMNLFYEQKIINIFLPQYNVAKNSTAPLKGVKGAMHPMYGHNHTEDTKEKMRKSARRGKDNHMFAMCKEKHPKFGIRYTNPKQSGDKNPMFGMVYVISGEKNGRVKLNKEKVIEIISSDHSYSKLSKVYNVSKSQIAKIKQGIAWKNLQKQAV